MRRPARNIKTNTRGIMDNGGKWSSVRYEVIAGDILVTASIPQSTLNRDGTIPKVVVDLLRNPSIKAKRQLLLFFRVHTMYRPLPPLTDITMPAAA